MSTGHIPFWSSRGDSLFCLFWLLEATCPLWLVAPPPHSALHLRPFLHGQTCFSDSLLSFSHFYVPLWFLAKKPGSSPSFKVSRLAASIPICHVTFQGLGLDIFAPIFLPTTPSLTLHSLPGSPFPFPAYLLLSMYFFLLSPPLGCELRPLGALLYPPPPCIQGTARLASMLRAGSPSF